MPQMAAETALPTALGSVKQHGFAMKRQLDLNKTDEAIKAAVSIILELSTSALSPKEYYTLFMEVTDQLRHLETWLGERESSGVKIAHLYEQVQYQPQILPRLYLMITVAAALLQHEQHFRKDVLLDLVEMTRGVQHPLRGLFLRNYLLQQTRSLLPDSLTEEAPGRGVTADSLNFILLNFSEMNKLWVRMQFQGHSRDKRQREEERQQLRLLVGTNLVRLSQLDSLTVPAYKTLLSQLLEQIINCRDPIAQEYLVESLIQVFPDELHLETLSDLLQAIGQVHADVDVKTIMISLIDRLAAFSARGAGIPSHIPLFQIFAAQIGQIIESHSTMPLEGIVQLCVSLANLATKCYPDRVDFVNAVFESTDRVLTSLNYAGISSLTTGGRELLRLFKMPIDHYSNLATLLELTNYPAALQHFDFGGRRHLALHIINAAVDSGTVLTSLEETTKVLDLVSVLVTEQSDQPTSYDKEDFLEDQNAVARFIHLASAEERADQLEILKFMRKAVGRAGAERVRHTIPALITQALRLAERYHKEKPADWQAEATVLWKFIHSLCGALAKEELAEAALRWFLQGALLLDQMDLPSREDMLYEFFSQAFALYEEEVSESRAQVASLLLLIGTLRRLKSLGEENHEPLRTQCALAASRLVKKPDQCRLLAAATHLFWSCEVAGEELRNTKKVKECLRKSVKIANQCMKAEQKLALLVELLPSVIYFAEVDPECEDLLSLLQQLVIRADEVVTELEDEPDQTTSHVISQLAALKRGLRNSALASCVPAE